MSIERLLKTVHSWLGVVILPWVVVAGLTGFYMNHKSLVLDLFPASGTGAEALVLPGEVQSRDSAWMRAEALAGAVDLSKTSRYEGREVFAFKREGEDLYVDAASGHIWWVGRYGRALYAPDGSLIDSDWRWSRILSSLHTRGWVGTGFGSLLADATALALMVFGLSGLVLFFAPRLRKFKNKRARMRLVAGQARG